MIKSSLEALFTGLPTSHPKAAFLGSHVALLLNVFRSSGSFPGIDPLPALLPILEVDMWYGDQQGPG